MGFHGRKVIGVRFDESYTTAEHAVGSRGVDDAGNEYVFVQAQGAISQYDIVTVDGSYDCPKLSGAGLALGVAPIACADNSYFWLQVSGVATAKVATSLADNAVVSRLTNGSGQLQAVPAVSEAGSGSHAAGILDVFGKALAAESSNLASIYIF